jgi:beta-lactam-binding protein with PASTA domain
MLGKVFNQRYRLKEKIGSGGMADVFLADDLLLGREVAIKVLHAQFASDPSFIQRFRYEAQAAANLNHPNIVNIYDWGNEGDLYYIVMEYVEGRDLKDLLNSEGRLTPEWAAEITAEISAALQFAHRRNLVHRDIKPHNIFITELSRVKVMDFGIAREGNGEGMTQTGVVMGTPQYISPEQAQGLAVDGRSDIYSLGVVLYEMLTGQVPFDDPSPVTIAYKQVREDPVPPSVINREVPPTLEAIVMKAMAKNPANRFQTAQEMKADLLRFLEGMPVTAPPVLPEVAYPATAMSPAVSAGRAGKGKWPWIAAGILAVLVVVGIVLAVLLSGGGAKVAVPQLVGLAQQDAQSALDAAGLKMGTVGLQYVEDASQKVGVVISQDPEWGTLLAQGETVNIMVTQELRMPSLVGMTRSAAEDALTGMGVTRIEIENSPVDDEKEINIVLTQDPASKSYISPTVNVKLTVGAEQKKKAVPDVVGDAQADAESKLTAAGFQVTVTTEPSSEVAAGDVIRQSPLANQRVVEGSTVTIVVSSGAAKVTVPTVTDLTEEDAKTKLTNAGLTYSVTYQSTTDPTEVGIVLNQIPLPGEQVDSGYTVRIFVGRAP